MRNEKGRFFKIKNMITKGFTLIELIIVIGIIALLATTVILVINPAKLFQEARDSQRIADFGQLNSALGLYLASASTPEMSVVGACGTNWWASISALVAGSQPFATPAVAVASQTITAANMRKVDGNGWIAVNFGLISSGSPLPALPVDPKNNDAASLATTGLFYAYQCQDSPNLTYELNTRMESTRFANTGNDDVESTDGGTSADIYEVGNVSGLGL